MGREEYYDIDEADIARYKSEDEATERTPLNEESIPEPMISLDEFLKEVS